MGLHALDFITSTKKPNFYNLDRPISILKISFLEREDFVF